MVKKTTSLVTLFIALAAVVVIIARLGVLVAIKRTPDVTLEDCWFETAENAPKVDGDTNCGYIEVFEDRYDLKGRKIEIHFAQFVATEYNDENQALFFFSGGPGEATINAAPWIVQDFAALRKNRDVVFVDIRGTGLSNPMACSLPGDPDDLQTYLVGLFDAERAKACYERVLAFANPEFYRTDYIAQDINDIRRAIGYEKIDVIGGSYGTRLAQVYMRRFPDHVRTATLQAPVRTGERMPMHFARDAETALDRLIAVCAKDPACAAAYPDFAAKLQAFVARIQSGPFSIEIMNPETNESETVIIPPGLALSQLRNMLYWSGASAKMPMQVEALSEGNYGPFVMGAAQYMRWLFGDNDRGPLVFDGLYLSVTCAEDVPFVDWDTAYAEAEGTMLGRYRLDGQRQACENWPVSPVDPEFLKFVESDIPTLIMVGEIDPVTPPRNAEAIAANLDNVLVLEFQNTGHGIRADCADAVVNAFIMAGDLDAVDQSCGRGIERPPFAMPE